MLPFKMRDYKRNPNESRIIKLILILIISLIIIFTSFFILLSRPTFTGLAPKSELVSYTKQLNLTANESREYLLWFDKTYDLSSVKINGNIMQTGSAVVYLRHDNKLTKIFDSNDIGSKNLITGLSINNINKIDKYYNNSKENTNYTLNNNLNGNTDNNSINDEVNELINNTKIAKNISLINETNNQTINDKIIDITNTTRVNETLNDISLYQKNKSITINLQHANGLSYDPNNDGIETLQGIVDLTVADTKFNFEVNESNLCTRWDTYSLDLKESTIVCYGSNQCCNFVNLMPTRNNWKDIFYSNYKRFGATDQNMISAQVIYVEYDLTIENPYSEVYYSGWQNLTVKFVDLTEILFEDICVDSCNMHSFKDDYYGLVLEVNNTTLTIDSIAITGNVINNTKVKSPVKIDSKIEDKFGTDPYDLEAKTETRVMIKTKDKDKTIKAIKFDKKQKTKEIEAGVITKETLEELKHDPNIEEIIVDQPISILAQESDAIIGSDLVRNDYSLTGLGQKICILDTGIDHNQFNSYLYGFDFINNDTDPFDDNGHGTNVIGVINTIAPNASLIVAKVVDSQGMGYESDVYAGLDYCISQNVSIISFSIGSGSYIGFCDSNIIASMANYAASLGIFVAAAAGNDQSDSLKSPACAMNVTSVAAVDKNDDIAPFTNINLITDLLAPGVDINTMGLNGYEVKSGTSMSAPFVSGVAALVLENETLSPEEIRYRLRSTGKIVGYNSIDYSRVDALNALLKNKTMEPYDYSANQSQIQNESYTLLAPNITTSKLNSTSGNNLASDNLTIYITGLAPPNATVAYNWIKNGTSLAVLNMPFDFYTENGINRTHDFSGYNNHGNVTNATFNGTGGIIRGAYQFDGMSSYISLSNDSANLIGNFTLSAWIKHSGAEEVNFGAGWRIISKQEANSSNLYHMRIADSSSNVPRGLLEFEIRENDGPVYEARSSKNLTDFNWHYVVVKRNNNNVSVYIDGVFENSSLATSSPIIVNAELDIGRYKELNQDYFNGTIDEVRIYNYSLTPEQIAANYNNGIGRYNLTVSQETIKGDNWSCTAWPIDSNGLNGSGVNCNTLTISEFTSPRINSININPSKPLNNSIINISVNISDDYGIDIARVSLYYPNGTFVRNLTLKNDSANIFHNDSYTVSFYPHGNYNVTAWVRNIHGKINNSAYTTFAPYIKNNQSATISINGSFGDWNSLRNFTDDENDGTSFYNFSFFGEFFGGNSYDEAGTGVGAGDFNNDGYQDLLLNNLVYVARGCRNSSNATQCGSGMIYLWNNTIKNFTYFTEVFGMDASDFAGSYDSVSGDFNNDGYDDILLGAYGAGGGCRGTEGENCGAGVVYLFNTTLNNFTLLGEFFGNNSGDLQGYGADTADFDNDGFDDIILGGYQSDGNCISGTSNCGSAVVYLWNTSSNNLSYHGEFFGVNNNDFALAVAGGDFNNDGYGDFVMGADGAEGGCINASATSNCGSGVVYLWNTTNNTLIFFGEFFGVDNADGHGESAGTGDFNNDGFDDIALGSAGAEGGCLNGTLPQTQCGSVIIYLWNTTLNNFTYLGEFFGSDNYDWLSFYQDSISVADFNNDGYDDFVVGGDGLDGNCVNNNSPDANACGGGVVYLFNATLNNFTYFGEFMGVDYSDNSGWGTEAADFNNDGYDDFVIGGFDNEGGCIFNTSAEGCGAGVVYMSQTIPKNIDLKEASIANNNSHLFFYIGTYSDSSLDFTNGFYNIYLSINGSTGTNLTTLNVSLPFNYTRRIQINSSKCYIYNYSNSAQNISGCHFSNNSHQIEIVVPFTILNVTSTSSLNVTFETVQSLTSFDYLPNRQSFIEYAIADAEPPIVTLLTPTNDSWQQSTTLTFSYEVIDTNIQNCTLYGNFNGTWLENVSNITLYSGIVINNSVTMSNGLTSYRWNVLCYDTIGNSAFNATNYTFTINGPPNISSVILNATSSYNKTNDNLTIHVFEVSDFDNHTVSLSYNWLKNNVSTTILNMPFDLYSENGVNRTHDFSGYQNQGNVTNATFNGIGGIIGGAYQFDGIDDTIQVSNDVIKGSNATGTIEAWIKLNALPSGGIPFFIVDVAGTGTAGLEMGINVGSPTVTLQYGNGSVQFATFSTTVLQVGQWYQVVGTWNQTGGFLYINGTLEDYINNPPGINISREFTYIGSNNGIQRYFNGSIDEVKIYNLSLSADQILANYNEGIGQYNLTVSQETTVGDNWSCTVWPIDSFGLNGSGVNCNTVIIVEGCGDGTCQGSESCSSCSQDCGSCQETGCFLSGTLITTTKGKKPIEQLKVGDKVLSYDVKNKRQTISQVEELYEVNRSGYYIINDKIKVTAEHPFFVDGNWKEAKDLNVNDDLMLENYSTQKISSIIFVGNKTNAFNLYIGGTNTYYAEEVLVHNKGGTGGGSCDNVICTPITITCSGGSSASCTPSCSGGSCGSCTPTCSIDPCQGITCDPITASCLGGSTASCTPSCSGGSCESCTPTCPDPCFGVNCLDSLITCNDGKTASCKNTCSNGACRSCTVECPDLCNGVCDIGEDEYNCPDDCLIKKSPSSNSIWWLLIAIIIVIIILLIKRDSSIEENIDVKKQQKGNRHANQENILIVDNQKKKEIDFVRRIKNLSEIQVKENSYKKIIPEFRSNYRRKLRKELIFINRELYKVVDQIKMQNEKYHHYSHNLDISKRVIIDKIEGIDKCNIFVKDLKKSLQKEKKIQPSIRKLTLSKNGARYDRLMSQIDNKLNDINSNVYRIKKNKTNIIHPLTINKVFKKDEDLSKSYKKKIDLSRLYKYDKDTDMIDKKISGLADIKVSLNPVRQIAKRYMPRSKEYIPRKRKRKYLKSMEEINKKLTDLNKRDDKVR